MTRMVSAIVAVFVTSALFLVAAYAAIYLLPYVHQYGHWIQVASIISLIISAALYARRRRQAAE